MRLWSLHPGLLDARGLVALWREALLAQKVLAGKTRGYRHHPQLERFRAAKDPMAAIGAYLAAVAAEANQRGYHFDASKILVRPARGSRGRIPVTDGQLAFELEHLRAKVGRRDPAWLPKIPGVGKTPATHPLFKSVAGNIEPWERPASDSKTGAAR